MTRALVEDWLDGARGQVNEEQFHFLQLLADRLMVESGLKAAADSIRGDKGAEPLRYLLHGPPGTGKSHVCKFVKELFALVNMKEGIDYQFTAFQATNAVDLEGDTIHHAFSLSRDGRSDEPMKPEAAKRMAMWRWLFIDEVSLVPANLLTRAEHRLQEVKPQTDEFKCSGRDGIGQSALPFAGINVVFIGDFKQLPPPQGGYLADVLHAHQIGPGSASKASDPLADAGRKLMWEDVQGIVELTERERCKDAWWNQVTDELRAANLTEETSRYLHGKPVEGCCLPPAERVSRQRVITGPDDPRLQEPKFQEAPVIVANNDAKYQINKDRAKKHAQDTGVELRWAIAKDVASSEVLRSEMCDKDRKLKRLGCMIGKGAQKVRISQLFQLSRFVQHVRKRRNMIPNRK